MKNLICITALLMCLSTTTQSYGKTPAHQFLSSDRMLGCSIHNPAKESVATVNSIVLDTQGKPLFVIAGIGGVAGIGQTQIAIPYSALKCECKVDSNCKTCHVMLSKTSEQLQSAPALKTTTMVELYDREWVTKNAEFYTVSSPATMPERNGLVCVKTINDADIKGTDNTSVGQLEAIIFDMVKEKASFAIIGSGGTVGLGKTYRAIPYDALIIKIDNQDHTLVSVNSSKETIDKAPKVTPEEYPEIELESVRVIIRDSVVLNTVK